MNRRRTKKGVSDSTEMVDTIGFNMRDIRKNSRSSKYTVKYMVAEINKLLPENHKITEGLYYKWENEERLPTVRHIPAIASALGVSETALFHAIIAFSKLYFSRYLWFLTWGITFLIFPFARVFVKHLLIKLSWFIRNTVIIGAGDNAFDVYNALKDEPYLGLKVICFISVSNTTNVNVGSLDIPILDNTDSWKSRMKKTG